MRFAQKSIIALSFCLFGLTAFAGQAPTSNQAAPEQEVESVEVAPTDYSLNKLYGQPPTRKGGMLIFIAGVAMFFLSPLAIERLKAQAS